MRTIRILASRTFWQLAASFTAWAAATLFLAAVGALFVGGTLAGGADSSLPTLWADAVRPLLAPLAVVLAMRLWSEERASGRLDLYLTAPLLERDLAFGKFFGAYAMTLLVLALSLAAPLFVLPRFAPSAAAPWTDFAPGFLALALEAAFFCAAGAFASACFRQSAVAAVAALCAVVALPYGAWRAAMELSAAARSWFAGYPPSLYVADAARGTLWVGASVAYAVGAFALLFACSKAIAFARLVGRGARALRCSTVAVVALSFVFAALVAACALRLDFAVDVPLSRSGESSLSPRTKSILADAHGDVRVVCFLARRSPRFDSVARLLAAVRAAAKSSAGARVEVEFVDPRWGMGDAARLVRSNVLEGTIVFSRERRRVEIPAASADEAAVASAILRLTLPAQRDAVYWTSGHGEMLCDSYDPVWGMSDFARDLRRDGYRVSTLAPGAAVPPDCAFLVVAGARSGFSREENSLVSAYLRRGGRMLVFASPDRAAGVAPLLAESGVRAEKFAAAAPTRTGSDVIADRFADHAVTRPLAGCSLLFDAASAKLVSSFAPEKNAAADVAAKDRPTFVPLVSVGESALAAAVERGGGVSSDLSIRPTRVVVVGDPSFVSNGALASRANANRDFALNAAAWLAGLDAITPPGKSPPASVALDRPARVRFAVRSAAAWPACVFFFGWFVGFLRRRASR